MRTTPAHEINVMTSVDEKGTIHLSASDEEVAGIKLRPLSEVTCLGCLQDTLTAYISKANEMTA